MSDYSFIDDLKFYDYNLIFSRCGSGSMFEILYYTDKVFFVPHLHSRDIHQKFNKMFFINKLKIKDEILNHDNLKILPNFNIFKIILILSFNSTSLIRIGPLFILKSVINLKYFFCKI